MFYVRFKLHLEEKEHCGNGPEQLESHLKYKTDSGRNLDILCFLAFGDIALKVLVRYTLWESSFPLEVVCHCHCRSYGSPYMYEVPTEQHFINYLTLRHIMENLF